MPGVPNRALKSLPSSVSRHPPACAGVILFKELIMLLPVFCGRHYSYFYEVETSHYVLLNEPPRPEGQGIV
jgi:hypothetical protein